MNIHTISRDHVKSLRSVCLEIKRINKLTYDDIASSVGSDPASVKNALKYRTNKQAFGLLLDIHKELTNKYAVVEFA